MKDIRGSIIKHGDRLVQMKGIGNEFVFDKENIYQVSHLSYFSGDYLILKEDNNDKGIYTTR